MRGPAARPIERPPAPAATPFVLGFVSTGIGKSAVARRLTEGTGAKVVDVSKVLCNSPATRQSLERLGWRAPDAGDSSPRLIDIMITLPRPQVLDLWETALGHAMAALAYAEKDQTRILLVGNMYHSPRRSEYYSPFSLPRLREIGVEHNLVPKRVVMFIDDIYDMYVRLAGPKDVFAPLKTIAAEAARIRAIDDIALEALPLPDQALVAAEVRVAHLVKLLHWRELEMTQAERTARSIGVPYLLWAVKQEVSAILPWLRGDARAVTYLSHPISRPRREFSTSGKWSQIVSECNALPAQLAALDTTAVMPTAIDEFRMARGAPVRMDGASRRRRRPLLTERWPLLQGATLYEPTDERAPGYAELLAPHRLVQVKDAPDSIAVLELTDEEELRFDPVLRVLESQIEAQVSARDHTIVVNTDHTVVFRPLYGEPAISRGVQSEIDHWQDLCSGDGDRRIAFLHRVSDVKDIIRERATPDECRRLTLEVIARSERVSPKRARELYDKVSGGSSSFNMLDLQVPNASGEAQLERVGRYINEIPTLLLRRELAWFDPIEHPDVSTDSVGIWVVPDEVPWPVILTEVVTFLSRAAPPPPSALAAALTLFP